MPEPLSFAGELLPAHSAGCAFVKENAMAGVDQPFDIVVTTNSGYPLDQNLYQSVKGMVAAADIVKPGGTVILAAGMSTLDSSLNSSATVWAMDFYRRKLRPGADDARLLRTTHPRTGRS